jgi:hypothetical protein
VILSGAATDTVTFSYSQPGQVTATVTFTRDDGVVCVETCEFEVILAPVMRAFRPLTPPFQFDPDAQPIPKYVLPSQIQATLGAGIRPNIVEQSQQNLIPLKLLVNPSPPPDGLEYALVRTSGDIRVWEDQAMTTAILDTNDDAVIAFALPERLVWVEWVAPNLAAAPPAFVELHARGEGGGASVGMESVRFFPFQSVVIVLGGRTQAPSDPPDDNYGIFQIGKDIYLEGFDVWLFPETAVINESDADAINPVGSGAAYDAMTAAIAQRGVTHIGILGYSYGGGATRNLSHRLWTDRQGGQIEQDFSISYTAYLDAIVQGSVLLQPPYADAEMRRPPGSLQHINYYQSNGAVVPSLGIFVSGALIGRPTIGLQPQDYELDVTITQWGAGLNHQTIDDHVVVQSEIAGRLINVVPR